MRIAKMLPVAVFGLALGASGAWAAEDITIAVVGPMTGPVASIGEQQKRGGEAAAALINEAGGVNGRKIKIVVEDVPTDIDDPFEAPTRRMIFERPREPETTEVTSRRPAKKPAPSMTRGAGVRDLPSRPTSRRGRPPRRHHPSGPRSAPPFRGADRRSPPERSCDRRRDRAPARTA